MAESKQPVPYSKENQMTLQSPDGRFDILGHPIRQSEPVTTKSPDWRNWCHGFYSGMQEAHNAYSTPSLGKTIERLAWDEAHSPADVDDTSAAVSLVYARARLMSVELTPALVQAFAALSSGNPTHISMMMHTAYYLRLMELYFVSDKVPALSLASVRKHLFVHGYPSYFFFSRMWVKQRDPKYRMGSMLGALEVQK